MTFINARGAYLKFDVVASSDLTRSCQIVNEGTPVDISGGKITTVVKDKDQEGIIATLAQTINGPATGEWTFQIPKQFFKDYEGDEMSYESFLTPAGGVDTQLLWGELDIYETV